jgi:hypothetical protein
MGVDYYEDMSSDVSVLHPPSPPRRPHGLQGGQPLLHHVRSPQWHCSTLEVDLIVLLPFRSHFPRRNITLFNDLSRCIYPPELTVN